MAKPISDIRFARFITAALFIAVAAGSWDAWWHTSVGRETFFEPPHLLLYAAVIAAIAAGVIGWYQRREEVWRRIALVLLVIPFSAPLDELWHRAFGVENIGSPLVIWSPPHLLLIFSIIAGFMVVLPRLEADRLGRQFFGTLAFAGVGVLLFLVATPFYPLAPYHLIGSWGAVFTSAVFIASLLVAQSWLRGFAPAVSVAVFFTLLNVMQYHFTNNTLIAVPFHAHPPVWLAVFSFLVPAVLLDLGRKLPGDVRGAAAGAALGAILFGAVSFFDPEFPLSLPAVIAAIAASTAGGVIGGLVQPLLRRSSQ
ncbi:MAG: hypothetical protein Q8R35_00640 [bacterium]|nr:hypothetical protein [bacterium]